MKKRISITDFTFEPSGMGSYKVTYTSPTTGKSWRNTINDMTLIDATRNASEPKKVSLEELKRAVKA